MERERKREERGKEGMRKVVVTSISLSHRLLTCGITGSIRQEGKPGNESTTNWKQQY